MLTRLVPLSVTIALAAGSSLAFAASDTVTLTETQKQEIAKDIGSQTGEKTPVGFHAAVGTKVPASMVLHPLPSQVSTDVASVKSYEFVKLQDSNQILLVNPSDRTIVAVIQSSATTTGSGGKMNK
jgi:hypothetical protein